MIYTATITDSGDLHHFASLDDELYIEVGRAVESGEEAALEAAFAGDGGTRSPCGSQRAFCSAKALRSGVPPLPDFRTTG